ncbi:MAG TPA: ATP-binding cassette domain-containing protein, partial [Solirubrobacterales bacterium]|nr:ATP-binding cassette domain-containing protein [Solirubrobacterales bacterium]
MTGPRFGRSGGAEPQSQPVELRGVAHRFGALEAINRIEAEVGAGEVIGLVGPSGCGKSTLLELVAGLARPTAGTIRIGDLATEPDRLSRCAYMPQRDLLLPWLTALDNAALAPRNRGASREAAR